MNQKKTITKNQLIKEATSKTELYAYKLILNTQIIDFKESLNLIDKQIKKIELKDQKQLLYEAIKKDEIKGNSSENILFTGGN